VTSHVLGNSDGQHVLTQDLGLIPAVLNRDMGFGLTCTKSSPGSVQLGGRGSFCHWDPVPGQSSRRLGPGLL
jgi:hypothetical protein